MKRRQAGLPFWIIRGQRDEDADPPHPLGLRARRERPRNRRAAEKRDERAPLHSITSSARCCRNKGTSMPIAFAVFRLITSSNFVGCSTGRSAGLVPCNILDTNTALRRYMCDMSAPYDNSPRPPRRVAAPKRMVVGI